MFESNYLLIMGLSGIVISLLIILHEPIFDGIDRIVARITVKKVLKKIDLYNGKIVFKEQIKQIFPSNKIYGLGVIGDSYTKDHIKSLFPKYAGIFKMIYGCLSKKITVTNFLPIQTSLFLKEQFIRSLLLQKNQSLTA